MTLANCFLVPFQDILKASNLIILLINEKNVVVLNTNTFQPKMIVLNTKELNVITPTLHIIYGHLEKYAVFVLREY